MEPSDQRELGEQALGCLSRSIPNVCGGAIVGGVSRTAEAPVAVLLLRWKFVTNNNTLYLT